MTNDSEVLINLYASHVQNIYTFFDSQCSFKINIVSGLGTGNCKCVRVNVSLNSRQYMVECLYQIYSCRQCRLVIGPIYLAGLSS